MKTLSLLHRWAGGMIGFVLALLALSGTTLLWEGEWLSLPGADDPVSVDLEVMASLAEQAEASGARSITFAGEETGLHYISDGNGGGAYYRQTGDLVAQWDSIWGRPEWWLFDLHHYLFAGQNGEIVTGIAGIAGLLFVITGAILWWRSRKAFEWRWWPRKFTPGPIVRHHRDLGIVIAPLLLVSMVTGLLMIFESAREALVVPLDPERVAWEADEPQALVASEAEIPAMFSQALRRYPNADFRRLSFPAEPDAPYSLRMRQSFEWTPNGRTILGFAADGRLIALEAPPPPETGFMWSDALYPVHSAKVGGLLWRVALTAGGLGLTLLSSLAVWSFWWRRVR